MKKLLSFLIAVASLFVINSISYSWVEDSMCPNSRRTLGIDLTLQESQISNYGAPDPFLANEIESLQNFLASSACVDPGATVSGTTTSGTTTSGTTTCGKHDRDDDNDHVGNGGVCDQIMAAVRGMCVKDAKNYLKMHKNELKAAGCKPGWVISTIRSGHRNPHLD